MGLPEAEEKDFRSIQLWWDRGKKRLKGLAIAFCSRKKALQERERALLDNLSSHLKAKIDQGSVSFMDIYENVHAGHACPQKCRSTCFHFFLAEELGDWVLIESLVHCRKESFYGNLLTRPFH